LSPEPARDAITPSEPVTAIPDPAIAVVPANAIPPVEPVSHELNHVPTLDDLTPEEQAVLDQIRQLQSEPVDPNPVDPTPIVPPTRPAVPSLQPVVPGATFENPDPLAVPPSSLDKFRKLETDAKKKVIDLSDLPNMQF
jgi:hypothetical protein